MVSFRSANSGSRLPRRHNGQGLSGALLPLLMLNLPLTAFAEPAVGQVQGKAPAAILSGPTSPVASAKTLAELLAEVEKTLGVHFNLAAGLGTDRVKGSGATVTSEQSLARLLKGYNWAGIHDAQGHLTLVSVTGRNGNGQANAAQQTLPALFSYRKTSAKLPKRYQGYAPGSVFPIDIPVKQLREMALGERLSLSLPNGEHELVHDNVWDHSNGDKTWVGKADDAESSLYRTQITLGDGTMVEGQIRTPEGFYWLESDDSGQWLIDVEAAGLARGAFDNGASLPPPQLLVPASGASSAGHDSIAGSNATGFTASTAGPGKTAEIDVLLLYSEGMAGDGIKTRLNSLMALANQALMDSRASVRLNLVGSESTGYPDASTNRVALDDLTQHRGELAYAETLRSKYRADLVMLMRAFRPKAQEKSCGEAWVNGSQGTTLSPALAFGVVNDGRADGYYCSNYTLAHEIGHLLGAAHDRQHANVDGHFPYSFGYGLKGQFGDIMSYISPEIGLFANPKVHQCAGAACGIAAGQKGEADVVSTFNQTARQVADFLKVRAD